MKMIYSFIQSYKTSSLKKRNLLQSQLQTQLQTQLQIPLQNPSNYLHFLQYKLFNSSLCEHSLYYLISYHHSSIKHLLHHLSNIHIVMNVVVYLIPLQNIVLSVIWIMTYLSIQIINVNLFLLLLYFFNKLSISYFFLNSPYHSLQ